MKFREYQHELQGTGTYGDIMEENGVLLHTAGECVQCGACESRCPFKVPVMENMKKAAEIFGK